MPIQIPIPASGLAHFDLQAELDGVTYTLELRWNVRLGAWFVRVLDEFASAVLVGDQRLVVDFPLAWCLTGRSPPGLLAAIDTSGQGADPGFDDLGTRVQLSYTSATELAT